MSALGRIPHKKSRQQLREALGRNAVQINTSPEAAIELSQHWVNQAFSALVSTVAQERINDVSRFEARHHERCIKRTSELVGHAKCVVDLLDVHRATKRRRKGLIRSLKALDSKWVGAFRVRQKREIYNRNTIVLKSSVDVSPFTSIARQITKTVRALKNKNETRSWQQIMVAIEKQGKEMEKTNKVRKMLHSSFKSRSSLHRDRRKDQVLGKRPLANSLDDYDVSEPTLDASEITKNFEKDPVKLLSPEAMNHFNMTSEQKEAMLRVRLIREGVKLGMQLSGQNVTDFDRKNLRVASPRFFSVVPEPKRVENDTINLLSPSLFSLHGEGSNDERNLSMKAIFSGLPQGGEQNALIDMLTEVTGVVDAVDDAARKLRQKTESEGILINSEGQEVPMTKENVTRIYGEENYRKMKALEKLHGMYTPEQIKQFNKTGYAVMTNEQRLTLYGKDAPFENEVALKAGENLTVLQAKRALHDTIRGMAEGKVELEKYSKRQKDIVLSPVLFTNFINQPQFVSQGLILSPVLFTSLILSPAIFGSVILSPWLFVPVILSPRLLSPVIISPALFSPIILSPLVLDPLVLTPGVANPLVLSPFVLCPFILSPQVMTPLILSPFALSPAILNPNVLGPVILSPFVLSPSILSPPTLTAVVLSPYALSPSIRSIVKWLSKYLDNPLKQYFLVTSPVCRLANRLQPPLGHFAGDAPRQANGVVADRPMRECDSRGGRLRDG
ncbi:unnamed protein product [Caenorhabditis auriculariae]|uniref:Uncharacterized protein n=1 Tax=Caenorhabditis auriculariae TaxID=2777116 RepID=A0A8S1H9Q1_9PELO|nr:unnamed protein product [Caenorhabditis auriculariae]